MENEHIGSNFEDFLEEQGILEEVTHGAQKIINLFKAFNAVKGFTIESATWIESKDGVKVVRLLFKDSKNEYHYIDISSQSRMDFVYQSRVIKEEDGK